MVVNHPSPKGLQICQAMFPVPVTTRLGRDIWRQGSTFWGVSRSRVSLQHALQDHLMWKSMEGKESVMLQHFGVPCLTKFWWLFSVLGPHLFLFWDKNWVKTPPTHDQFQSEEHQCCTRLTEYKWYLKVYLEKWGGGAWVGIHERLGGRILMKLKGKVTIANEGF